MYVTIMGITKSYLENKHRKEKIMKKKVIEKVATMLAGTGVIPIPKTCLEALLADEHFMLSEEALDGESEGHFMRRTFNKALQIKSIVKSTKQCMIINAPVGHGKMSVEEIEQLSSYITRWTIGDTHYTMNWGLYEIPNSLKMRITIVANSTTLSSTSKVEVTDKAAPGKFTRRMIVMCTAVIVGIISIALSLHYMELGVTPCPLGMSFVDYLKYMLHQSYNRYEVYSMIYWAIGGCALLYVVLSINVKNKE